MLLKEICKTCHKPIKNIQAELPQGNFITYVWNCGHIEMKPKSFTPQAVTYSVPEPTQKELYEDLDRWVSDGGPVKKSQVEIDFEDQELRDRIFKSDPRWDSLDGSGNKAYEYQMEGVRFAENTKLKVLIGDAMGVGKTIQGLMCLKRNPEITTPTLWLTKSSIVFQTAKEYRKWVSKDFSSVNPIVDRCNIFPGFKCYIMSMDFLGRKGVLDLVKKLGIKCIVMDEVQSYKDSDSKRTKCLIELIQECKIEYRIALSGTPIKNRVSEYFTILNLLDPKNFSSLAEFKRQWLTQNEKGVYTKLNPYRADRFKEITGKYIIRREKHEVLKNLPPLVWDYQLIEIEDEGIKKSYNHQIGLFNSFLRNPLEEITSTQLLGWLARLRAITGMAKVPYAVEWIKEFLDSSEDSISVAIHHENVRDMLYNVFRDNGYNPLSLSGKDDMYAKDRIQREFNAGHNRVLVINALAGGVGLNLQSCANALILERQWNFADEDQFASRFHRDGQTKGVTMTVPIAKGTIDEFYHDMVFAKRRDCSTAGVGAADDDMNSLQSLKEFAEFVASNTI